jgi:hypothetical protein
MLIIKDLLSFEYFIPDYQCGIACNNLLPADEGNYNEINDLITLKHKRDESTKMDCLDCRCRRNNHYFTGIYRFNF